MVRLMPFFKFNIWKIFIAAIVIAVIFFLLTAVKITRTKNPAPTIPDNKLSTDLKKGIYKCPSVTKYCTQGKDIFKDNQYIGFGILATSSAIMASFDGIAKGLTITLPTKFKSEKLNVIYLDNKENNIRATYYFKGDPISINNLEVKEGTKLGVIGEKMQYYDTGLLFFLTKTDGQKQEIIRITLENFI